MTKKQSKPRKIVSLKDTKAAQRKTAPPAVKSRKGSRATVTDVGSPTTPTLKASKRTRKNATPPLPQYPAWSTAKFWAFLRSGLRAKWQRWPPKYEALKLAKRTFLSLDASGKPKKSKQKFEYQCAACSNWFPQKEVSVDHIVPVGSLQNLNDLPGFVDRLFVGIDKLQVLCDTCHKAKTKEERDARASDASNPSD